MIKRRYFLLIIPVIFIFILNACGGGAGDTRTAVATDTIALTGANPEAEKVSQASIPGAVYAVEVVKTLTPSVVQVVTETVATGTINQPGPSMGPGGLIVPGKVYK